MGAGLSAVLLITFLAGWSPSECWTDTVIRIHLAGDSTMAAKKADKRPETGWGEMLQPWFDQREVVVRNHAKNGRSTRTFIEEGRWEDLLEQLQPGDYVFIQFGHNDQSAKKVARYTPPDQYQANLERFVTDVRARDGNPVLLTPVVRRRFDDEGNFYDSHGEYPGLVRKAAQRTHTALIDMESFSRELVKEYGAEDSKRLYLWLSPGEFGNYPEGLEDNTHFSPRGAQVMTALVVDGIIDLDLELAGLLRKEPAQLENESSDQLK